jgi:hypothetical protein
MAARLYQTPSACRAMLPAPGFYPPDGWLAVFALAGWPR